MGLIAQRSREPFAIPMKVSVDPNGSPKYGMKISAKTSDMSPSPAVTIDIGLVIWVYEAIAANAPNIIASKVNILCIGCRFAGKIPTPIAPIPQIVRKIGRSFLS